VAELVRTRRELSRLLGAAPRDQGVGLVPTMGALHAGHLALVAAARAQQEVVVCSIFVNPLQFDDPDDLARYPVDLDGDVAKAAGAGATICFAPSVDELYPGGCPPQVSVDPGPLGDVLEGAARPGHLRGVATVVAKLFALVAPTRAYFGEKDYQQLVVVRRMALDLSLPVEVVGCPTVREPDGLALSSRNVRLSPAERRAAPVLYRALQAGAAAAEAGERRRCELEAAMAAVVGAEPLARLEYAAARLEADLEEVDTLEGRVRLLVAARVGSTRLIDNLGVAC